MGANDFMTGSPDLPTPPHRPHFPLLRSNLSEMGADVIIGKTLKRRAGSFVAADPDFVLIGLPSFSRGI